MRRRINELYGYKLDSLKLFISYCILYFIVFPKNNPPGLLQISQFSNKVNANQITFMKNTINLVQKMDTVISCRKFNFFLSKMETLFHVLFPDVSLYNGHIDKSHYIASQWHCLLLLFFSLPLSFFFIHLFCVKRMWCTLLFTANNN